MLYHLSKTRIYRQSNQNWCWAACFLWIINSLKIQSVHNTESKILRYYFQFLLRSVSPPESDEDLYSNYYDWGIDLLLIPKLIDSILQGVTYESGNVHLLAAAEKESYIKAKFSYDNIEVELSKNKAPIVVFSQSHMILITGYGKKGGCEYLLKSDPMKGDAYISCDEFISNEKSDIRGVWTLKSNHGSDLLVNNIYEEAKTIYRNIKSINSIYDHSNLLQNNFLNIIPLSKRIKQIIQNHPDNNTTHLEHRLASFLKGFHLNSNCLPLELPDVFYAKDLENTFKIIQSYILSEGRSVSVDYLGFVLDSSDFTEEFTLIDRNNNLEFFNKEKRLNFLELKSFIN